MTLTRHEYMSDGYSVTIQHCEACGTYLGVNYPSDFCTGCTEPDHHNNNKEHTMARIKIMGYVDTDELEDKDIDLNHAMGVSTEGYETGLSGLQIKRLDDVDYELIKDED